MTHRAHLITAIALTAATACGGHGRAGTATQAGTTPPATVYQTPAAADTTMAATNTYKHHSVLAGAAAGAAAGHMLGHHAILGAAAGALIQHERNKHQRPRP